MREDVVEVISCNETIVIKIRLHEDLLDLLIVEVLSEILGHLLELVGGDLALS